MKKVLFVDDSAHILQEANKLLMPVLHDFKIDFVKGGERALRMLRRDGYDIVFTDIQMPKVSGTDILQYVSKRYPNCVRIVLSNKANIETLLKTADIAHQYISKPFTAESLTSALSKAVSFSSLIKDKKLRSLMNGIRSLPSFPSLYLEIVEELQEKNPSAQKVGEIISRDMSMSAKVLQLVNSAYFGLSRLVNDPSEAAVILGLETIRDLVLSLHLFSQFDQNKLRRLGLGQLWNHSLSTGLMSKTIVRTMTNNTEMLNSAFLAGLLHDLGKLILIENFTMKYYSAIGAAAREGIELLEAEKQMFGTSHAKLGAYLLGSWGLPVMVTDAIAYHHDMQNINQKFIPVAISVHAANVIDHTTNKSGKIVPPVMDSKFIEKVGFGHLEQNWWKKFNPEMQKT